MSDVTVGKIEFGPLAGKLNERSKFDDAMIVGSEIRAALQEQRQEIERLEAENAQLRIEIEAHSNDANRLTIQNAKADNE